ncbi:MAG: ABC transporter permease subunit [Bdellovibrionales bacterium]|nr:ABC transporter permease subunit [Bdellovibrionales bacterium]
MSPKNIYTIWKREIRGYFYTPLAYVFIGVFSLLMGVMFSSFLQTYMQYTMKSTFGMAPTVTIDRLAEAFYANMHVILMFVLPFFTMRLFTEESRQNTLVLLMTSPIRMWEVTLAKFLAGASMLVLQLAVTFIFPVFLILYSVKGPNGGPDLGIMMSTYLGLLLAGMAYIAFGLFWSSVTESQLVAVVMSFATNFGFWLLALLGQGASGSLQDVLKYMAINEQFMVFAKGTIELRSLVYFCSIIFMALFLTNRSLESRAWRS